MTSRVTLEFTSHVYSNMDIVYRCYSCWLVVDSRGFKTLSSDGGSRAALSPPGPILLNQSRDLNSNLPLGQSRWPPLGGLGVVISLSLISLFNWPRTVVASGPVVWPHARLT